MVNYGEHQQYNKDVVKSREDSIKVEAAAYST
jgi:hypothetical protein